MTSAEFWRPRRCGARFGGGEIPMDPLDAPTRLDELQAMRDR